jgi:hypothetical protein
LNTALILETLLGRKLSSLRIIYRDFRVASHPFGNGVSGMHYYVCLFGDAADTAHTACSPDHGQHDGKLTPRFGTANPMNIDHGADFIRTSGRMYASLTSRTC